jgi:hypothetical protein
MISARRVCGPATASRVFDPPLWLVLFTMWELCPSIDACALVEHEEYILFSASDFSTQYPVLSRAKVQSQHVLFTVLESTHVHVWHVLFVYVRYGRHVLIVSSTKSTTVYLSTLCRMSSSWHVPVVRPACLPSPSVSQRRQSQSYSQHILFQSSTKSTFEIQHTPYRSRLDLARRVRTLHPQCPVLARRVCWTLFRRFDSLASTKHSGPRMYPCIYRGGRGN